MAVVLFPERYFECAHSGNSALCPTRSFLGRHLAQITAALKHFLQFRTSHSMRKTLSAPVLPLMEHLGALLNEMPPSDTDQGSWPSQSVEMDKRPVQKFRQGLTGAPAAAGGEQKQVTGSLARSPHPSGASSSLTRGEGRGVSRGRAEGRLRWFAHPLAVLSTGGTRRTLLLPLTPCFCSSEVVVGVFLVFLCFAVQNLPQLHVHARSYF